MDRGRLAYYCNLSPHPLPRNLENVEAGWGQVLVPRVLALLTRLAAEVQWALPWDSGGGGGGRQ